MVTMTEDSSSEKYETSGAKKTCSGSYASMLAISAVFLLSPTPSYAGCLCDVLSSNIKCSGITIFLAFCFGALLLARQSNWRSAKRLSFTGAILLAAAVATTISLNSDVWYTPGTIANSQAWLEGGVPAHWVSLLAIGLLCGLVFIACSMVPTALAFQNHSAIRGSILKKNIAISLIPVAFLATQFFSATMSSSFVMMFWSILLTDPKLIADIQPSLMVPIAFWSLMLGVFIVGWGMLMFAAVQTTDEELYWPD